MFVFRKAMRHMVMGDKQSKEEEEMVVHREDEDDEEDGYFSGYAHFSIHHDMLAVKFARFSSWGYG